MELLSKLMNYEIDDRESSFKFSDRLARENMWTPEYAKRVIDEYKKFMYLGVVRGPVTPSLDVDEVWHLHMIYTRDYWGEFRDILGTDFHHGPTKGGKSEDNRYMEQYNRTLDWYKQHFGPAPEDIWPPAEVRFSPTNTVRVDLMKHWVIPAGDIKGAYKAVKQHIKNKLKSSLWNSGLL